MWHVIGRIFDLACIAFGGFLVGWLLAELILGRG